MTAVIHIGTAVKNEKLNSNFKSNFFNLKILVLDRNISIEILVLHSFDPRKKRLKFLFRNSPQKEVK